MPRGRRPHNVRRKRRSASRPIDSKTPRRTETRWCDPGGALLAAGGFAALARRGKVIVATATRWTEPLLSRNLARHGPRGSCLSSRTVSRSELPGARAVRSLTGNGPARRPPGPPERVSVPLMSSVRPPLLRTFAITSGRPVAERFAVSERIVKFDASRAAGADRDVHPNADPVDEPDAASRRGWRRDLGPDDRVALSGRRILRNPDRHSVDCRPAARNAELSPLQGRPGGQLISAHGRERTQTCHVTGWRRPRRP